MTPKSTTPLRRGDAAWRVTEASPDYAIFHDPPWPFELEILAHPAFGRRYPLVWSFEPRPGERLLVYQRGPD